MSRVGAIDIGSDSTRMLVAEVEDRQIVRRVVRRSVPTRLSEGLYAEGVLTPASQARVLDALARHTEEIAAQSCELCGAVVTSAVRDARNGAEFVAELRRRFRLHARVIDGHAEAELTFRGATLGRELAHPVLVVDIGGGSTDLMVGDGTRPLYVASTQAGVIRKAARFLHSDPPRHEEVALLRQTISRLMVEAVPPEVRERVAEGLVSAEAWTWLPALALLGEDGAEAARTGVLGQELVERALERLISMRTDELRSTPGIHPARAPTLVAGAALLAETIAGFGLPGVEIAGADLLEGLALQLAAKEAMVA